MNEIDMTIRSAEPGDIPGIMKLLKQVNNVHANGRPDLFKKDCTKYEPDEIEQIIADPTSPVFVGVGDDGSVMGYAFCQIRRTIGQHNLVDQVELYIDDICIEEALRGQGLATRIYNEVLHYAKKNAFDRITLHVWECNPAAKHFYEKCGMKPYFYAMEAVL